MNTLKTLSLKNNHLELSLIPDLGGKITSLRKRGSAHEWLWHSEELFYRHPTKQSEYHTTNLGGIDDCLPSVKPQVPTQSMRKPSGERFDLTGLTYSDHGEIWRLPASLVNRGPQHLTTEVVLTEMPLIFERTVTLNHSCVEFAYKLTNTSQRVIPFIWSAHPLFRIEPGDRIEMQPIPRALRIDCVKNLPGCEENALFAWPEISPGITLEQPPIAASHPYYTKLFFESGIRNAATLVHAKSSERLTMRWWNKDCPYFGLWLTAGEWNGHTHVAFEPTNYPSDCFLQGEETVPGISPLAAIYWKFEIHLL